MSEPHFFKSASEFRRWLEKNHNKATDIWVGLYKKGANDFGMSQSEAIDQALCFGWIFGIIKGLDHLTYQIRFVRRKPNSAWSLPTIKRAKQLKKIGLMHSSGIKALESRDRKKSEEKPPEFSGQQIKLFKANKKAWEFFNTQTKSYKRYTTWWVISAKRPETQLKRLQMLIEDSASGSKLRRIVEALNKIKKTYEPGKTPIEEAKNIGPVCGQELRSVGVETVEQLQALGWEEAAYKLCETYPNRINLNMMTGLIGAVENQHWRDIGPSAKASAKNFLRILKRQLAE